MRNTIDTSSPQILPKDKELLDQIYYFKRMRQNYEPMSYLSRRAYEGKHFTYWNKTSQKIVETPQKKTFFNQLPEVAKQTDAFENFLVSNQFVFTVVPKQLSDDDALSASMKLSLLAEDYYKKLQSSTIYADLVHYAIMDNVSFIEISPNDQKDNVEYKMWDFFDILFNPTIKDWNKQKQVFKIVRRKLSDLKQSKLYNLPPNYKGGGAGGFQSWKDIYEQEKYSSFVNLQKDEVLLFECYLLDDITGLTIRTLDGMGNVLRDDNYRNIKRIPIRPLRVYSGEWYQPSYVYRLIPMNRSLDTIANRFEDLVLRLSKGGWIKRDDENIDGGLNEETGQIINYQAVAPTQIEMPPIPNFLMDWFSNLLGLTERYGLSSIFSGALPNKSSGLRAGKMIDQIQGLTQQNNTATINNLRNTIQEVLEFTFQFLYEMWDTPQDVLYDNLLDQMPKFISEKYRGLINDPQGTLVGIPANFKRFDVDIDDGMGYTLQERKNTAIQLLQLGLISPQVVQKLFKLGASGYIMEAADTPLYQTQEFQTMQANWPNLTDEQKQAMIITMKTIGQQQPAGPAAAPVNPGGMPMPGGQPMPGGIPGNSRNTTGQPAPTPFPPRK